MSHPVVDRLLDPDPAERIQACTEAVEDPAAVLLAEPLADRLADPVRAVSQAAADALVAIARAGGDVVPHLRAALRGADPLGRSAAALALARLEPPSLRIVPALVDGLGVADGKRRWQASRLLVETGRLHGEVLPALVGLAATHESPVVRRMVHHCLRELAPDAPETAAALVAATRDPDVRARRAAYAALAALIDPPAAVVDRLTEALDSEPDGNCRRISTVALATIGAAHPDAIGDPARDALRRATQDPDDPDLRRGAKRALLTLGTFLTS